MRAFCFSVTKLSVVVTWFGGMSSERLPPVEGVEQREHFAMLRLLAFRIEPDAQLDAVADFLADRVIVNVPGDLRSGQHQAAGVGPHLVGVLADGPFHEQPVAGDVGIVGEELARQVFVLLQARQGVMRDLASPRRRRSDLDGAHPARFGQAGRQRSASTMRPARRPASYRAWT